MSTYLISSQARLHIVTWADSDEASVVCGANTRDMDPIDPTETRGWIRCKRCWIYAAPDTPRSLEASMVRALADTS